MDQESRSREEKTEDLIQKLTAFYEERMNQGLRKSRGCAACDNADPLPRFFSSACGHAVCRECATDADACPACAKAPTSIVRIFEDENRPNICGICESDTPGLGVFVACGHTACGICALRILLETMREGEGRVRCPFCRALSDCYPIEAEFVEENNEAESAISEMI